MRQVQKELFSLQDNSYKEFQSKLIPTVSKEKVIGVRTPKLRQMAKRYIGTLEGTQFMQTLPHTYFDENQLHAFMIEEIKDFQQCLDELERFLPFVDNWATCDQMSPKVFKKHLPELREVIWKWLHSGEPYTVRYGIGMLMKYFLDEEFSQEYFEWVIGISSGSNTYDIQGDYYVDMMIAWYFATALAKQYDAAIRVLEERRLPEWTHKQTIKKAMESYRITAEQKQHLRALK